MKKVNLISIAALFLGSVFFSQTSEAKTVDSRETTINACKVKKPNTNFFVSATETTIRLRKGTALSWTNSELHQGLIVVKAKVGTKWVKGEILLEDTTCN